MKLTNKDLVRFLQDDTFIKFVAKKRGFFLFGDDDLAEARFFAIRAVMRLFNGEIEFQDDKHLYGSVEMCVFNSLRTMVGNKYLNKNNLPVSTESSVTFGDGEETFSLFEINAVADNSDYDNDMEFLHEVAESVLTDREYLVFTSRLDNMSHQEIAEEYGFSREASRNAELRIIKKLKKVTDADKGKISEDVPRVRETRRSKSVLPNKATPERSIAASSFLGI